MKFEDPMKKIAPPEPETRSADVVADNIAKLKTLFPEIMTEGPQGPAVNVDVLKALVGDKAVTDVEEKFGLNWHGKRRARQLALTPSTGTLRPCPEDSVNWDTTQNLMIEGDNLEVLKLLQKSYSGQVKLIYIDPPYNTGKDFVYPDNFQDNIKNYLELTGQVEGGRKISSNVESSGRFHTDWLNMMYPRLRLARSLLGPFGLICISIDDHELQALRSISDEIFGEESFVGTLTWITTTQPDNIGRARFGLQQNIEYVLMYSRSPRIDLPPFALRSNGQQAKYPHIGKFGPCRFEIIERSFVGAYARPTMRFTILGMNPREGKQWQIGEEQARELEAKGKVEIVDGIVKRAVYPEDEVGDSNGLVPFWAHLKEVKTSQTGKAELNELLGPAHGVDTVKPTSLVKEILNHMSADGIVLDFFAGSGTSGHAVMDRNAVNQRHSQFILVQLPEPLDPSRSNKKASADFCDKIKKPRTIAELTKERLRRAAKKIKDDNPMFSGDLGFRVFKLDSTNIRAWDPDRDNLDKSLLDSVDHLKPGRSEEDILYEMLLKQGFDLCVPIEKREIGGKAVHSIGGGVLIVCLSEKITRDDGEPLAQGIVDWHKSLAPAADTTCIFRDSAFADDVAKTNLAAILSQQGIANVRSL